ncbi:AraC family transcriptional regulator [Myroides injenensis]|uniref:AraC family transcriptional regulator n=1 Tax=Myroides injenensis TaxID=1183151 RepID=UPI00028832F1|nr:AraC family transcriptional regulator [Myroides injenensis]
MLRENLHKALEIFYEHVDTCPIRNRLFNFFEFVYVISGDGYHCVNDNKTKFEKEDLFLITPEDKHSFDLTSKCEFVVIRFNNNYIAQYRSSSINHIECLLYYASGISTPIISDPSDKYLIRSQIEGLMQTIKNPKEYNIDLQNHFVYIIMIIATRNISQYKSSHSNISDKRILEIITYIQKNIYDQSKLTANFIGSLFGIAPSYIGTYFLRKSGETLQHFINCYRLELIKNRLLFSDKRITEITEEFGFTDESHANKFFKKQQGITMTTFRSKYKKVK